MAKDMKDKGGSKRSGSGIPGPVWFVGGFALGVIVTVLYRVGTPAPGRAPIAAAPTTAAAAPATANEYAFYDILGNLEVAVPGKLKPEAQPNPATSSAGATDGKPGDGAKPAPAYALQVGAFRTATEADRMRAELALLGFEARIQKATIDDKDTWFRVRLGPFKDAAEFEKVRARLDENKIKSVPVRSGP
jgi:cell division protein FtsN